MALPKFFSEKGYINPTDPTYCPFNIGHATGDSLFSWFSKNPLPSSYFLQWMTFQREGMPIFLDAIDFQREFARDVDESTPIFVDVGGAKGHQCIALRKRFPTLTGRIVLQEQAHVVAEVSQSPYCKSQAV